MPASTHVDLRHLGVVLDLVRRAVLQHPAVVHDGDLLDDAQRDVEVVLDDDETHVLGQRRQERHQLAPLARRQAGRGLVGDRYHEARGTFSSPHSDGHELTLVEAEVLEELGFGPETARRNVVTRGIDLNALVGQTFTVGDVVCAGRRLCEPCAHLQRLTEPGMLRKLAHKGGLRADILEGGRIAVGDEIRKS